jgi:hypothetical protein
MNVKTEKSIGLRLSSLVILPSALIHFHVTVRAPQTPLYIEPYVVVPKLFSAVCKGSAETVNDDFELELP